MLGLTGHPTLPAITLVLTLAIWSLKPSATLLRDDLTNQGDDLSH